MAQPETELEARTDLAIEAAADALLAVCALQTGLDPLSAMTRATKALRDVFDRAEQEQRE